MAQTTCSQHCVDGEQSVCAKWVGGVREAHVCSKTPVHTGNAEQEDCRDPAGLSEASDLFKLLLAEGYLGRRDYEKPIKRNLQTFPEHKIHYIYYIYIANILKRFPRTFCC